MKTTLSLAALASVLGLVLAGCSTAPSSPAAKASLSSDTQGAMSAMEAQDPELKTLLDNSYGYALFPSVGKGGLVVGGAYGRGEVIQQGRLIGYADLSQATVGLQAGGQEYAELIVFQTPEALERFKSGNFEFSANASAVALKAGAATAARFENGVAVFTMPKGGLMFEASIGGQKFSYQPRQGA